MGWDIPDIPGSGTIATVAGWATKLISCLRYLKGLDSQVPTIQSGLVIDNTDGDEYLKLPLLTTAQTGTTLVTEGKVAFDSQTHAPKYYDNTAVKQVNLLSDCDIASAAQGDILYRGASAWTRLAKGTAGQYLWMNAGATAPQWTTGVIPSGIITIWTGTIANIPSGFVICDGNNSTPNLLAKFVEGVATAATEPGTTGGATSKNLDIGGSEINKYGAGTVRVLSAGGYLAVEAASATASYPVYGKISDIRPSFYDVAFLMKS